MNTTSTIDLGDNDSWIGPDPAPIEFIPARTSATHRHYPKERLLTPEQLAERLDYWQHRLCLHQWIIDFKINDGQAFPESDARCHTYLEIHRATIEMILPDHRDPKCDPYDMEQVLVHELLHIHFAAQSQWNDNNAKMTGTELAVCVEQPIERLSWVLVEQQRQIDQLTAARDLYKSNFDSMAQMNNELLNTQIDTITDLMPMPPRACPSCTPRMTKSSPSTNAQADT